MKKTITCIAIILIYSLTASINLAQGQKPAKRNNDKSRGETSNSQFQITTLLADARPKGRAGFSLMPANTTAAAGGTASISTSTTPFPNLPVFGSGSLGRLTKWTGFTSSSSAIGDSNIYEDKFGKVGIGTTSPTSLLTVQGVIETFGGIKFADGTTQSTSTAGALFGVAHDPTLQGNGTAASPLGVAVPLNLSGSSNGPVITANNGSAGGNGVNGFSNNGDGVRGVSGGGIGVSGFSNTGGIGVFGGFLGSSTVGIVSGVVGIGKDGASTSAFGGMRAIGGNSISAFGGEGMRAEGGNSTNGNGGAGIVAQGGFGGGVGNSGGPGIFVFLGIGSAGATDGLAGKFIGDVQVIGNISATNPKMFKIDHPLDPENKYLKHAAIESSEVLNIYSGNITTDPNGDATIGLPDWFEALNKDFRYQLTVIGAFAQAIVASKMKDNRFAIKTNAPDVEVSWQVTGVRSDAVMKKYPFKAEEEKAERERGYYLTPEVFNQPEEKSIEWARNPEMMQKLKQQRLEAEEKIKKQQPR